MALNLISDKAAEPDVAAAQQQQAARFLGIALKALSEKALIAAASLFSLLIAASVFWLYLVVAAAPTNLQQIGRAHV